MGLRSGFLVVLAPLVCACASDATTDSDLEAELPFEMSAPDASVSEGAMKDGAVKPSTGSKRDASAPGEDLLNDDNACAATSVAAEQVVVTEEVQVQVVTETPAPVALYVMFDRSTSMASSLWTPAVAALKSFVQDDSSAGMDIALQYFPSGGSCNGSGYSTPAVAMGRLPAHESAIISSLSSTGPSGFGTPIEGALRGVTEYCKSFQATHSNEKCIAVLVTDGKPEFDGCEHDEGKLAAIAKAAWDSSKVRTFAVGLKGADFGLLDAIAKAGNAADCDTSATRLACDVSAGADRLTAALAKIRESVKTVETRTEYQTKTQSRPLECEWVMPQPQAGMTVDKDRVNVTLGGSETLQLGRVPSADKCQGGAWHFDSAQDPKRIVACPATCDAIKAGVYTDVKILLGCDTYVIGI